MEMSTVTGPSSLVAAYTPIQGREVAFQSWRCPRSNTGMLFLVMYIKQPAKLSSVSLVEAAAEGTTALVLVLRSCIPFVGRDRGASDTQSVLAIKVLFLAPSWL